VIRVAVVGATGYTGSELLRLLIRHPEVSVQVITSRTESGVAVADFFPTLRNHCTLSFSAPDTEQLATCDVVFFATPNGTAMLQAPELLNRGIRVIDLAADFRIRDVETWQLWYKMEHACPELLSEAVYGLPELDRDAVRQARLVANPGCYPTAIILGLLPLLEAGVIDTTRLIADAKSGVSGAGRHATAALLMAEVGESFKAYGLGGHRHHPEMVQIFKRIAHKQDIQFTFVPHLLPMIRGIEATIYAPLQDHTVDVETMVATRYGSEPFVDVMPAGISLETRSVKGTNLCRVSVTRSNEQAIVIIQSVIDNLVKGAAGQAIQNMNLMCGLDETLGLTDIALSP
jgi:N-acetyl-gamma-glutamyl-phosphate reductase